jgi:hypothetical protein
MCLSPARAAIARNLGAAATNLGLKHCNARRQDWLGGRQMRSILLLFLGVPIPIILLLALCSHNF